MDGWLWRNYLGRVTHLDFSAMFGNAGTLKIPAATVQSQNSQFACTINTVWLGAPQGVTFHPGSRHVTGCYYSNHSPTPTALVEIVK